MKYKDMKVATNAKEFNEYYMNNHKNISIEDKTVLLQYMLNIDLPEVESAYVLDLYLVEKLTRQILRKYILDVGTDNFSIEQHKIYRKFRDDYGCVSGSLESFIAKYGENEGIKKKNEYTHRRKSPYNIDDVMTKNGCSIDEAIKIVEKRKEKTAGSLNTYINRYGKIVGTEKYDEFCKKSGYASTIGFYTDKWGEDEGTIRYYKKNANQSMKMSKDYIVKTKGIEKFEEIQQKKRESYSNYLNSLSPEELNKHMKSKCTTGYNISKAEYKIMEILDTRDIKYTSQFSILHTNGVYVYDIKVGNNIIEYNGDFWHCHPEIYTEDFIHPIMKKTASEIWKRDEDKTNHAISSGYKIFVIWESDDLEKQLNRIIDENIEN